MSRGGESAAGQEPGRQVGANRAVLSSLKSFRSAFVAIGAVSAVINILALTGSFFMLQVYDRVIPGRSMPTLAALCILAAFLFAFQGILELIRTRLLVRVGMTMDLRTSADVYTAMMRLPLRTKLPGDGLQPLRDLDQVRGFLSGPGPTAFFDLPWVPLYIGICFIFHFWIGVTALGGAIVLFALTLLTEWRTREPSREAGTFSVSRASIAEATSRNVEALQAMGFGARVADRWASANASYLDAHARASDVAGSLGTLARTLRMILQSGILAIGAVLVVLGQATGGIMIASSIMMSRALAPIELAIANWKGFVAARQSWKRLARLVEMLPPDTQAAVLPAPHRTLTIDGGAAIPPGDRRFVLRDVSFALKAGDGLGVIGPSASGKSSLARLLAGVWLPAAGAVRLDGATFDQWSESEIGRHIGYLPQDMQLFDGTVAENISRFDPDAPPEQIYAAAEAAGVHDMIVHLPAGFETRIGDGGSALSAGQRQRVALARALYGDPFLVVLDEPNSNLDAEGEAALTTAIQSVRTRGGIVVVIAHRPSALASVDLLAVLAGGRMQAFGPKAEVLARTTRPAQPTPLKVVPPVEESA